LSFPHRYFCISCLGALVPRTKPTSILRYASKDDLCFTQGAYEAGIASGSILGARALSEMAREKYCMDVSFSDADTLRAWLDPRRLRDHCSEQVSLAWTGNSLKITAKHSAFKIMRDNQCAGIVIFKRTEISNREAPAQSKESREEIHYIYVAPQHRGQGLGHQLLQHACSQCKTAGKPLFASIHDGNPESEALFRSFGFQFVKRDPRGANIFQLG